MQSAWKFPELTLWIAAILCRHTVWQTHSACNNVGRYVNASLSNMHGEIRNNVFGFDRPAVCKDRLVPSPVAVIDKHCFVCISGPWPCTSANGNSGHMAPDAQLSFVALICLRYIDSDALIRKVAM